MTTLRVLCSLVLLALTASPVMSQAAPAATAEVEPYRVGPGDGLEIKIHSGSADTDAIELEFPISGDGSIDVVGAGRMKVAGLTTSEVQDRIRRRLIDSGYLKSPFVSVNVTEYASQCVNVAGAVTKQGRFCLRGVTRLLDILSQAEGVDEESAGRLIVINRTGATEPIRIDRRELVSGDLAKSQAANVRVLAGDNVYVPVKARFCISGPLEEAGCFAFDDGATLMEAIAMAKGTKETADRANVTIRRRDGAEVKVNLTDIERGGKPAPLLEADDQIVVGEVLGVRFCVNGQVNKADCYEDVEGITIEGAISKAGGLVPNKSDRENILVRRIRDGRQKEVKVNLNEQGPAGDGFPIEMDDQIVVQALDCLITVGGGVKESGQFDYTTGMTLTDALQAAKGYVDENGFALGKLSAVTLRRGENIQTVDAKAIMRGKAPDVKLQCGDKIHVPTRAIGAP